MTPRYLSEPAAWREIARRIAEGEWSRVGLCRECTQLHRENHITMSMWTRMHDRVREHMWVDAPWLYAFYPGEAAERVLAALFLALEAESERP